MSEYNYPDPIVHAVDSLCEVLIRYYPEVFNQKYNSMGLPDKEGVDFKKRMQFGVYFELLKSGVDFKEEHSK